MRVRPSLLRRRPGPSASTTVLPPDPPTAVDGPLDPVLLQIRASLLPHRRRLWVRRLVRRAWIVVAGVLVAELILWTVARLVPLEPAPLVGAAIPVVA
jgi:hypothetical protein